MKTNKLLYGLRFQLPMYICLAIVITFIISLFCPIVQLSDGKSIYVLDFVINESYSAVGSLATFARIFYIVAIIAAVASVLSMFFLFITAKRKENPQYINYLLYIAIGNVVMMLFSTLLSAAIASVIKETVVFIPLVLGTLLLVVDFVLTYLNIGRRTEEARSNIFSPIISVIILVLLVVSTLFIPLYFGKEGLLNTFEIFIVKNDQMSYLKYATFLKVIVALSIIAAIASFVAALFLYNFYKARFDKYLKYNTIVSSTAIAIYAFVGFIYASIDTDMTTLAYIPFLILATGLTIDLFVRLARERLGIASAAGKGQNGLGAGAGNAGVDGLGDTKEKRGSADPIPAFAELDSEIGVFEKELASRNVKTFSDVTLPKLVEHIINYAKNSQERLSYYPTEIRTFLAGLGSSRLSILQGMSGTGKTSLPKIFMEAIDGICDIVAVESSWRDKNELLGFYNEFNGKFTPKSFTQFLYKACLNKQVPYFIVLDEMNLSRIEYYFSDFLSLMEHAENKREIKLFDVQLHPGADKNRSYLALKKGHTIEIPTNVWFIGTANRDESTFEISDKVYDRAQTINFDRRAAKITDPIKEYPSKYVPYIKLREMFAQAEKAGAFDAEKYETIKKVEILLQPHKISFGNRILKQIEKFVKIYVACAGATDPTQVGLAVHEAVDCILLSKVVRKMETKQVANADTLINGFEALKLVKCTEYLKFIIGK